MPISTKYSCFVCKQCDSFLEETIKKKPNGETDFGIDNLNYMRIINKCNVCNVYNNHHDIDLENLYSKSYNESTYSNSIKNNYNRIMRLPESKSDNKNRVSRIVEFYHQNNVRLKDLEILDIGSGLCVFLGEIKKYDAKVSCVDPSQISIKHALENVGVDEAFLGNFFDINFNKKYDLITFNKVLEHVTNPVEMLLKAKSLLTVNGIIYIELPDGENASNNGGFIDREEFYLEHYTIYSKKSVENLVNKSGFKLNVLNTIHEPSDKYTVYCFISHN